MEQFWMLLSIFLAANAIGVTLNHIDDTDETFGYWEPLHYLLHGVGMQTWEYDPFYAIRTYAFVSPFWVIGWFLHHGLQLPKLTTFYVLRMFLGLFAAYSESSFVTATFIKYGESMGNFTLLFTLFSSGILYAATAFLPSAVIMSFVMLSASVWMHRQYGMTILYGCLAVLWSGWPFVGVLYIPLGLHMLWDTYQHKNNNSNTTTSSYGIVAVMHLIIKGCMILIATGGLAALIDIYYYQKFTSPTWNILLYNAIGGSGDELYGIETTAYYIKNLFLNMGLAWPLAVAAPMLLLRNWMQNQVQESYPMKYTTTAPPPPVGVLFVAAVAWLSVLFHRPHKEERFMYPIYPLLALMAAYAASTLLDMIMGIVDVILDAMIGPDSDLPTPVVPSVPVPVLGTSASQSSSSPSSSSIARRSKVTVAAATSIATNAPSSSGSNTGAGTGGINSVNAFYLGQKRTKSEVAATVSTPTPAPISTPPCKKKPGAIPASPASSSSNAPMNPPVQNHGTVEIVHLSDRGERKVCVRIRYLMRILAGVATFVMCFSRTASNYLNFKGYMSVWQQLGTEITTIRSTNSYTKKQPEIVTVCTGAEWYTFPSHFFLPENVQLAYVRDSFHGQLPQYFASVNGTSTTIHDTPFNDRNQEVPSRYVPLSKCDYLIAVMTPETTPTDGTGDGNSSRGGVIHRGGEKMHLVGLTKKSPMGIKLASMLDLSSLSSLLTRLTVVLPVSSTDNRGGDDKKQQPWQGAQKGKFQVVLWEEVINPEASSSALARAYFLPGWSGRANRYDYYTLLRQHR